MPATKRCRCKLGRVGNREKEAACGRAGEPRYAHGDSRAFNRNDISAAEEGLDPDVAYIIRGRATVSGTYWGRKAMAGALRRVKELADGTMAGKPEVVLAKGDEVMMYMRVTGSRPDGRDYDNYQAYLYRFRHGRLVEGQTIPVDQHAFEELFAD